MRILPDAIDARIFNPPDTALNQITRYMTVTLVEIGHHGSEPAVGGNLLFILTGMDVHHTGRLERSLYIVGMKVEPFLRRLVLKQVVLAAAMVENHIHHYFQTFSVCLVHHVTEILIATEAPVYLIIICNGIPMIRTALHVIFLRRVQPDGRHSQIGDIIQMVRDTQKVSPVTGKRIRAVQFRLFHAFHYVIIRIPVGKAVGHNQIQHILGSKSFHIFSFSRTRLQFIRNLKLLLSIL